MIVFGCLLPICIDVLLDNALFRIMYTIQYYLFCKKFYAIALSSSMEEDTRFLCSVNLRVSYGILLQTCYMERIVSCL